VRAHRQVRGDAGAATRVRARFTMRSVLGATCVCAHIPELVLLPVHHERVATAVVDGDVVHRHHLAVVAKRELGHARWRRSVGGELDGAVGVLCVRRVGCEPAEVWPLHAGSDEERAGRLVGRGVLELRHHVRRHEAVGQAVVGARGRGPCRLRLFVSDCTLGLEAREALVALYAPASVGVALRRRGLDGAVVELVAAAGAVR
jgi:hypothetical protein